jgi:hypothetical protein
MNLSTAGGMFPTGTCPQYPRKLPSGKTVPLGNGFQSDVSSSKDVSA